MGVQTRMMTYTEAKAKALEDAHRYDEVCLIIREVDNHEKFLVVSENAMVIVINPTERFVAVHPDGTCLALHRDAKDLV